MDNNLTDLEKEAEEYEFKESGASSKLECHIATKSFIAGANSNYAKQQVIKGKIEALMWVNLRCTFENYMKEVIATQIKEYQAELKQLETPKI